MYTSFHSSIGVLIMLAMPNPVGLILAYFSHMPTDILSETHYTSKRQELMCEAFLAVTLFTGILFNENFFWLLAGAIAANLMDIIDKFIMSYLLKRPAIFRCHQGGFPVILIDYNTTVVHNFTLTFLAALLSAY